VLERERVSAMVRKERVRVEGVGEWGQARRADEGR